MSGMDRINLIERHMDEQAEEAARERQLQDLATGLLARIDQLCAQIGDLQAWNRDQQAQIDRQARELRRVNTETADLGQWLDAVACDMLERTRPAMQLVLRR